MDYKGIQFEASFQNFNKFIVNSEQNKIQLMSLIKDCQLDNVKIRYDVWRLYLGVINVDSTWEQKVSQLNQQRQHYKSLLSKHIKKNQTKQSSSIQYPKFGKNPLQKLLAAKPAATLTKQQKEDNFLQQQIKKDVERTYQQRQFFKNKQIIKILSNVLFIWCKQFPEISYRQGMNQLGASLVYVYFSSSINPNTTNLMNNQGITEELQSKYLKFHSTEFAEADIFCLFHKLMVNHKEMFKLQNQHNKQLNPNSKNNSPLLQKIIKISDVYLKAIDGDLFRHIKLNQVIMRPFLLRWIKCIHTRQFELEESFVLWDNIFLAFYQDVNQGFYFLECTTLAMLVYLRDLALKKDSSSLILQLYQKYPKIQGKQLQQIVNLAWTIKDHLEVASQREIQKKKQIQFNQNILGQYKPINQKKCFQNNVNIAAIKHVDNESNVSYPDLQFEVSEKITTITKQDKQFPLHHNNKYESLNQISQQKQHDKLGFLEQQKIPTDFNIFFDFQEIRQIEDLLKRSLEDNNDIESRSCIMKVMKMFYHKEQQQVKKIQGGPGLY